MTTFQDVQLKNTEHLPNCSLLKSLLIYANCNILALYSELYSKNEDEEWE